MAKPERFRKIYSQGTLSCKEIWIDAETGVQYFAYNNGSGVGLCPLLDRDGKPLLGNALDFE